MHPRVPQVEYRSTNSKWQVLHYKTIFFYYCQISTRVCKKCTRKIEVEPSQRCLQKIVWRSNTSDPINTQELNTVTDGQALAQFLAIRCPFKLECESTSPNVAEIIRQGYTPMTFSHRHIQSKNYPQYERKSLRLCIGAVLNFVNGIQTNLQF